MRIVVVGSVGDLTARLLPDAGDGAAAAPVQAGDDDRAVGVRAVGVREVTALLAGHETRAPQPPRWVWWSTLGHGDQAHPSPGYPELLRAGVRLDRAHDAGLTERLLAGHEVRPLPGAAWAQLPAEPDPPSVGPDQPSLFAGAGDGDDADTSGGAWDAGDAAVAITAGPRSPRPAPRSTRAPDPSALVAVLDDQQRRARDAAQASPRFGLLVAAESAAALAAAEMSHAGLPWRVDVHDRVLSDLLGPRPAFGGRPAKLQALADQVAAALAAPGLNPDSQPDLLRALRRAGLPVRSTSKWELRRFAHPVLEPLNAYKELYRLHVAHGWSWADQWVREGRFHPQYVPGGVVSGRWATRGGGALQIPRAVRAAVVPDEGWVLVGADAGQLEPRVLAALSGDRRMAEATRAGDLYAALAEQALGRVEARHEAKIALLAAMYGGGVGSPELAALRRRFPDAFALVEDAARTGESGGVVRSVLGRTCPPPSARDLEWPQEPGEGAQDQGAGSPGAAESALAARGRARGRFTRNFVIQASAADWANALIAVLRGRLAAIGGPVDGRWHPERPHLVFFQHDEVLVHSPAEHADEVCAAVRGAAAEATRLVLGDVGVPVPMEPKVIASYAEKG